MLEPIIVNYPGVFPHSCMGCTSDKGPMLDFHREPAGLRVYFCDRCVKDAARKLGYVDGEEADARQDAFVARDDARRGEATAIESLGAVTSELEEKKLVIRALQDENELLAAHVSQLEHTIEESAAAAKAHLALVGNARSQE
ncbi:MAG: hypothetical protein ACRD1X_05170 [Vicinamibacteria bacterium]